MKAEAKTKAIKNAYHVATYLMLIVAPRALNEAGLPSEADQLKKLSWVEDESTAQVAIETSITIDKTLAILWDPLTHKDERFFLYLAASSALYVARLAAEMAVAYSSAVTAATTLAHTRDTLQTLLEGMRGD
jgi:hypothetical protein